ncbi:hypothetical protein BH11PSE5_BH11PSE5_12250 [soil metagenome]
MSRDQRPARPVIIDSGAATGNSPREMESAAESVTRQVETPTVAPPRSNALMSALFVVACIVGAACTAVMQSLWTQP